MEDEGEGVQGGPDQYLTRRSGLSSTIGHVSAPDEVSEVSVAERDAGK